MSTRTRIVAAGVFGVALVTAISMWHALLLVAGGECCSPRPGLLAYAIHFGWPPAAAVILVLGLVRATRVQRARPLLVADGAIIVLTGFVWEVWDMWMLWVLAVAMVIASVTLRRRSGTRPQL